MSPHHSTAPSHCSPLTHATWAHFKEETHFEGGAANTGAPYGVCHLTACSGQQRGGKGQNPDLQPLGVTLFLSAFI